MAIIRIRCEWKCNESVGAMGYGLDAILHDRQRMGKWQQRHWRDTAKRIVFVCHRYVADAFITLPGLYVCRSMRHTNAGDYRIYLLNFVPLALDTTSHRDTNSRCDSHRYVGGSMLRSTINQPHTHTTHSSCFWLNSQNSRAWLPRQRPSSQQRSLFIYV